MRPINVGLIGYGLAGKVFHAPLIDSCHGYQLRAIVTTRQQEVLEDYPGVEVITSAKALFREPDIDLVVIATPNDCHYPLAKEAIQANKHVVVDKPFVIHSEDGWDLKRQSTKQGVVLSVFHNRRWDNDFLTIKQVLNKQMLGTVHTFHAHYHRYQQQMGSNEWRSENQPGSGVLYDLGAHLIDQALLLFGKPKTISAELINHWGEEKPHAPDYFHLTLGYEDNRRIYIQSGSKVCQAGPRYEIHGEAGSLFKSGIDSQEDDLKEGKRPNDPDWGMDESENYALLYLKNQRKVLPTLPGRYPAFYEQLERTIRENSPNPVPVDEAITVIEVIETAIQSHMEKKVIPFD